MSLVSQTTFTNPLIASPEAKTRTRRSSLETTEATLGSLLGALTDTSQNIMDRNAPTYSSQPGSHPSYPPALSETQPEENSPAHGSATHHYTPSPGLKSSTGSPPEYGVYPTSACSTTFPDHIHRQSHPASNHSGSSGGMPQSTSPSLNLQDGRSNHHHSQIKSDQDVPIDPTIAASSPTYPTHGGQYSPYPPQQDMSQAYSTQAPSSMYTQPRPDWAGYAAHPQHSIQGGYAVTGAHNHSATTPSGGRSGQVYSFVPIPGAQQHKRPRRRYEEIERMYKCGWNGCEKAYGTLNHLNAHVTMQSHGVKRTPDEFKEIRKEWKARKKEEENQRKADEDRNRAVVPNDPLNEPSSSNYTQNNRSVQLPPIGYQTGAQVSSQYQTGQSSFTNYPIRQQLNQSQSIAYSGYPASPYGAPNQM